MQITEMVSNACRNKSYQLSAFLETENHNEKHNKKYNSYPMGKNVKVFLITSLSSGLNEILFPSSI